jgi:hypothetical protein
MNKLKKPIANLMQMKKDTLVLLNLKDNGKHVKENRNEGKKLAVWSRKGKTLITTEEYCDLGNSVAVDMIECPFDDFNAASETKKRNRKSFERTKSYFDTFVTAEVDRKNDSGNAAAKLLPVVGYDDPETLKFYLEHIIESKYKFTGVVYHGFEKNEKTMELRDFDEFKKTVTSINVNCC